MKRRQRPKQKQHIKSQKPEKKKRESLRDRLQKGCEKSTRRVRKLLEVGKKSYSYLEIYGRAFGVRRFIVDYMIKDHKREEELVINSLKFKVKNLLFVNNII